MNFDIKDVKSWYNRHDVKIGAEGYFCNRVSDLYDMRNTEISKIERIFDNRANCFSSTAFYGDYSFFLPLNAVKEDKAKNKYRPFKSMRELTDIIYSIELGCSYLSVGDSLWVRRKGDKHFHQNLLIISLGYDENDLISLNGKPMQEWLDNFEFLAHCEWQPFGVEKK